MRTSIVSLLLVVGAGCTDPDRAAQEFGEDDGKADGSSVADDGLPRLDVNDVSILYPLPRAASGLSGLLELDEPTIRGPLLARDQFTALLALAHPEDDGAFVGGDFDTWHVVGVRIDTCAQLAPDQPCAVQLRLVAQSFDGTAVGDNAIHLVFTLDPSLARPMARDFVALKTANAAVTTNRKALRAHPTLAAQGLDGAFATTLRSLIRTYAGQATAINLAVMLTLNAGTWRFATAVVQRGSVVQLPAPCSPTPTIAMVGTTGTLGNFLASVNPKATCADNVNRIIDSSGKDQAPVFQGSFFKLSAADQAADVDAALRILNPSLHGLGTTDCVSCHTASRALARVEDPKFPNLDDGNPNRFVPPKGITTRYLPEATDRIGPYNVRAFGYQPPRSVAYSQVTVNTSAVIADSINRMIREQALLTEP